METKTKKDLKINGDGSTTGGTYENVLINGMGRVNGDIDCEVFKCNGDAKIIGNVNAGYSKVNGSASITGDLKTGEFKVMGFTKISGNVESKNAKVSGQLEIEKNMTSEEIEINGEVKVNNDCNTEKFYAHGAFAIGGLLNAGEVDIKLYGPCRVKEIGCEKIDVRKGNAFNIRSIITSVFPSYEMKTALIAETIEGDEIYLENTKAKVVRGNNINIGPGCQVELVEYKTSFQKTDDSTVKENLKI